MPGYGDSGIARVGIPAHISARDNDPSRVLRPGDPGIQKVLNVQPWDVAPIPSAQNFFLRETANLVLGAAAGATVTTTIAGGGALLVPANNICSIQAVILFCDAPTLTTSITYTVRANQVGIPGLTNLGFPPQAGAFINLAIPGPFNVLIAGAFIDVLITRVVADVAKQVNFTIIGWFNSPQDAQRWTGVVPGQV